MTTRILAAIAAALLLVFAACGDDVDDATSTPSPSGQNSGMTPRASGVSPAPAAPSLSPSPTALVEELTYVVKDGDTLNAIGAQFDVTADAIAAANGIDDPTTLQPGQELIIPGSAAPSATSPSNTGNTTPAPADIPGVTVAPSGEVGLLSPVDKQHALPDGYAPPRITTVDAVYVAPGYTASLRGDVVGPLAQMLDAASAAGYDIRTVSAYRSYDQQVVTFNYWVSVLGYDEAIRVSAMPGHSEHQLGTTVDLGTAELGWSLTEGFGATAAGQWLAAHSHEYGFALSYPADSEAITGYSYEPWHFRYIGTGPAAEWEASGLTLNQYLTR